MLAGAEAVAQRETGSSPHGIVSVVGRWSEPVRDGDQVVLVEDSRQHTPSPDTIEQTSTLLFSRVDSSFAENALAAGAFSLGVLPNVRRFSDGTFRAQFQLVSGATDQTAGLVFDLRSNGEYLFVRYNTREGNIALWRYANGNREVVARGTDTIQLPLGVWHELSVAITGTRVVGAVNDTLRLEHTLQAPADGRIGFWAKRDSVTMFKNIRVPPTQ